MRGARPWVIVTIWAALTAMPAAALGSTPSQISPVGEATLDVAAVVPPQPTSPASGSTVIRGRDVTFSATDATNPTELSVDISSSPTTNSDGTLANADLDSLTMTSAGSGQPFSATSSFVTGDTGTIYWVVYRVDCSGGACGNVASPVQTLVVVPPPPPSVKVHLVGPTVFHIDHPTIRWEVDCNVICSGSTYYRASVRKHGRLSRLRRFDVSKTSFALSNAAHNGEVFTKPYRGRAVRQLRAFVARHGRVRFDLFATVSDIRGHSASDHRVVYMLPKPPPAPPAAVRCLDPASLTTVISVAPATCVFHKANTYPYGYTLSLVTGMTWQHWGSNLTTGYGTWKGNMGSHGAAQVSLSNLVDCPGLARRVYTQFAISIGGFGNYAMSLDGC